MGKSALTAFVSVAIIAVIAGGWLLFRDRLSGSAEDVRVGDCFDVPTEETVKSLQHQPCTEAHDGEAYVIGTSDADSYPVVFGFDDWVEANCLGSAFETYVGEPVEARPDIAIAYFSPTREGWESGDREITCYLTPADGQRITSSYQAAAAPAAS
jgi:hypothetical protein